MLMSTLKEKNKLNKLFNPKQLRINTEAGFTLIEILTSLLLISLTFGLIATGVSTSRDRLDSTRQQVERAIAFSIDESTIRNALVRIHFRFDDQEQSINVEAGSVGNYMLPKFLFQEQDELSKEEVKEQKQKLQNKFNTLKDFQESQYKLSDDIRIIGVASSISKQLVTEGESAIYFYPTGEKDDALIIIGSDEEVIAIKLSAFLLKIDTQYVPLELLENENIPDKQIDLAKEIFEKWLKDV